MQRPRTVAVAVAVAVEILTVVVVAVEVVVVVVVVVVEVVVGIPKQQDARKKQRRSLGKHAAHLLPGRAFIELRPKQNYYGYGVVTSQLSEKKRTVASKQPRSPATASKTRKTKLETTNIFLWA